MKKALCFILALMLFVGLTACNNAPKGETFYLYEIQENGETIHMEDLRKEIEAERLNHWTQDSQSLNF